MNLIEVRDAALRRGDRVTAALCDIARGEDWPGENPPGEADADGWRLIDPSLPPADFTVIDQVRRSPDPIEAATRAIALVVDRRGPVAVLNPVRPAPPTKKQKRKR